jgi:tripartite-type tricarboxylate transporter receptor subunit TctC
LFSPPHARRAYAAPRQPVARHQALNNSTRDPKVRGALESRGATIVQHTPEDAFAFVKNEVEKWGPVVKRAGVAPD